VLARFMAAHWSTEAVHIVPVFGETGALLEHWVFRLFYNWPLTIRRRMRRRAELRASIKPRYWHVALCAVAAAFGLASVDYNYLNNVGNTPGLKDIWYLAALVPLACGALVTLGCGGAKLWKRIVAAAICGIALGVLYPAVSATLVQKMAAVDIAKACAWRVFVFAILSPVGAIATELKLPEPKAEKLG
jgi:MFS family permease